MATDRIMVRSGGATITYLPDARWADEAPLVLQALLVRSIDATGRIGYVGSEEGGPVPDRAVLARMDAFEINFGVDGQIEARVRIAMTVLDDRTERVLGSRSFLQVSPAENDSAPAVAAAFQTALDALLPLAVDWVLRMA